MVLSQGNEKGKLEICRDSVLSQERIGEREGRLSVCFCAYTHQLGYL